MKTNLYKLENNGSLTPIINTWEVDESYKLDAIPVNTETDIILPYLNKNV